jgi:hypothetical protein
MTKDISKLALMGLLMSTPHTRCTTPSQNWTSEQQLFGVGIGAAAVSVVTLGTIITSKILTHNKEYYAKQREHEIKLKEKSAAKLKELSALEDKKQAYRLELRRLDNERLEKQKSEQEKTLATQVAVARKIEARKVEYSRIITSDAHARELCKTVPMDVLLAALDSDRFNEIIFEFHRLNRSEQICKQAEDAIAIAEPLLPKLKAATALAQSSADNAYTAAGSANAAGNYAQKHGDRIWDGFDAISKVHQKAELTANKIAQDKKDAEQAARNAADAQKKAADERTAAAKHAKKSEQHALQSQDSAQDSLRLSVQAQQATSSPTFGSAQNDTPPAIGDYQKNLEKLVTELPNFEQATASGPKKL